MDQAEKLLMEMKLFALLAALMSITNESDDSKPWKSMGDEKRPNVSTSMTLIGDCHDEWNAVL